MRRHYRVAAVGLKWEAIDKARLVLLASHALASRAKIADSIVVVAGAGQIRRSEAQRTV